MLNFTIINMKFENKIKVVVAYRKTSLAKLAEETGINYANIARWARNDNQPNLCDSYRMAVALDCKMEDLVLTEKDLL